MLGPIELAAFKAISDRARDWADIEEMVAAGTLDLDAVRDALDDMLGPDDRRWERLETAEREAAGRRG